MMKFETILGRLEAKSTDIEGYTTYVFEQLDNNNNESTNKFIMCVRYPNWNDREINIGEIGFVKVSFVEAGIDQWWDGVKMNYYNYDDVIFYKFIEKPKEPSNELFL